MKVAVVHEWVTVNAGSESCFKVFANLYPKADIFLLVSDPNSLKELGVINPERVKNSFIQKLPKAKVKWKIYLPLFPLAVEQHDLSNYDLIISSSHVVAKGVLVHQNQIHITYMHSPVRYAWDLYHQYLKERNLHKGLKSIPVKWILHYLRLWDVSTANRPDYYIANSKYIAGRIKKIYNKEADVIYPPVDTSSFNISEEPGDYYFTFSRMVPYKKIDLIAEAFSKMPEKKLLISGDGPELDKIKAKAGKNVELLGFLPKQKLIKYLQKSKAFVFAAEEDFGIAPVEAQACGIPVIAYGKGGALESVRGSFNDEEIADGATGIFYHEQSVEEIIKSVEVFENNQDKFSKEDIRKHALTFDESVFRKKIKEKINQVLKERGFNKS